MNDIELQLLKTKVNISSMLPPVRDHTVVHGTYPTDILVLQPISVLTCTPKNFFTSGCGDVYLKTGKISYAEPGWQQSKCS